MVLGLVYHPHLCVVLWCQLAKTKAIKIVFQLFMLSQKIFQEMEKKLKNISDIHFLLHINEYKIGSTPIIRTPIFSYENPLLVPMFKILIIVLNILIKCFGIFSPKALNFISPFSKERFRSYEMTLLKPSTNVLMT